MVDGGSAADSTKPLTPLQKDTANKTTAAWVMFMIAIVLFLVAGLSSAFEMHPWRSGGDLQRAVADATHAKMAQMQRAAALDVDLSGVRI